MDKFGKYSYESLRDNLLAPSDAWSCKEEIISREKVLIIDDALKEPFNLRGFSSSLDYNLISTPREFRVYPGERATVSWNVNCLASRIVELYFNCHDKQFFNFKTQGVVFTRMNNDKLKRIHPKQQAPHIDFGQQLVALFHLSDGEDLGATGFYRHIRTGIDYFPHTPSSFIMKIMESEGFNPLSDDSYREFIKHILYEDIGSYASQELGTGIYEKNKVWDVANIVHAKFNRLVIFPGHLIHSPIYGGSRTHYTSRITLNLAFIPQ